MFAYISLSKDHGVFSIPTPGPCESPLWECWPCSSTCCLISNVCTDLYVCIVTTQFRDHRAPLRRSACRTHGDSRYSLLIGVAVARVAGVIERLSSTERTGHHLSVGRNNVVISDSSLIIRTRDRTTQKTLTQCACSGSATPPASGRRAAVVSAAFAGRPADRPR